MQERVVTVFSINRINLLFCKLFAHKNFFNFVIKKEFSNWQSTIVIE